MGRRKTSAVGKTEMPADSVKVHMTLQRRGKIADLVQERGAARVNELADHFQVSEVTIRNDLDELEKEGQLTRDHGGAIAPSGANRQLTSLLGIEYRASLNLEAKRRIGREGAQRVCPGDTILMDAGTTTVQMAPHLAGIAGLTVVTNGLNVAFEVGAATDARVILLGGTLNREACATQGALAEQTLGELVVQKLFLGTQAFDLENGLTDTTPEIAQIKRAMIRATRQIILLTDSTKWARTGFIKVAPLNAAQTLISDTELDAGAQTAIERLGVEVKLV